MLCLHAHAGTPNAAQLGSAARALRAGDGSMGQGELHKKEGSAWVERICAPAAFAAACTAAAAESEGVKRPAMSVPRATMHAPAWMA